MVLGICGELLGNDPKGVPGETVGDNQDPAVWLLGVKEINRKTNEIIPVSSYKTSPFPGCVL